MLDQEDPLDSLARMLCSNFRSGGTDGKTQEDDSFARMLSSFRSSNPDGKTEEEYLGESDLTIQVYAGDH
jgi:hypothetical protein